MKKSVLYLVALCLFLSCESRKGSGNIIKEEKNTEPFNALNVRGGFAVEIRNGVSEKVMVEADDNLMKYIEVKVVSGELRISIDKVNVSNAHLKVFITERQLNKLEASAAAEIVIKDELKSNGTIDMNVSSGSNIKSAVDAPEVKVNVSSGGGVTLSGHTKDFRAVTSSGSSIIAGELLSENSFVNASSGGDAHVYASVSLDANASSGGNISYRGGASNVKKIESSGGDVEKND